MKRVHAALIASGWGGDTIQRRDFDAAYATHVGKGTETLRRDVETGRLLGLWTILDGGPRNGKLRILVTEETKTLHEAGAGQPKPKAP